MSKGCSPHLHHYARSSRYRMHGSELHRVICQCKRLNIARGKRTQKRVDDGRNKLIGVFEFAKRASHDPIGEPGVVEGGYIFHIAMDGASTIGMALI